jgi:hypothetical protein
LLELTEHGLVLREKVEQGKPDSWRLSEDARGTDDDGYVARAELILAEYGDIPF